MNLLIMQFLQSPFRPYPQMPRNSCAEQDKKENLLDWVPLNTATLKPLTCGTQQNRSSFLTCLTECGNFSVKSLYNTSTFYTEAGCSSETLVATGAQCITSQNTTFTVIAVRTVTAVRNRVPRLPRFRVYIHRPQLNFWQSFVRPFDLGVWTLTGFVLVTGSVMLACSYRKSREIGADHEVKPVLHRIQDAFLVTYGAMLQQGNSQELVCRSAVYVGQHSIQ